MPGSPNKEVLVAAMQDVRPLAAILRGVHFPDEPRASIVVSEAGLMVTVEYKRVLLASAYLYAQMFNEYAFNMPDVADDEEAGFSPVFEIKLSLLLQALDIFGNAGLGAPAGIEKIGRGRNRRDYWDTNGTGERADVDDKRKATAMRLTWVGTGHPLTLRLAGDTPNVSTLCNLTTFEPDPKAEFPFDADQVAAKIIMKSSWLRDALSEIDPKCEKITIICSPPTAPQGSHPSRGPRPTFQLKATSDSGTAVMDYPDNKDVLEVADFINDDPVIFTYRYDHIVKALSALRSSLKTSLRMDFDGLLSLQFQIPFRRPRTARDDGAPVAENYIEFRCAALIDDQ